MIEVYKIEISTDRARNQNNFPRSETMLGILFAVGETAFEVVCILVMPSLSLSWERLQKRLAGMLPGLDRLSYKGRQERLV